MVTNSEKDKSVFVYAKDANTGKIRRVAVPADFQVGLQNMPAALELFGGLSLNVKEVKTSKLQNAIYAATNNDTVISVTNDNSFSSSITIVLPSNPKSGQVHFVKDASGTAFTANIVLTSSNLIDDASLQTISIAYGTLAVYFYGGEWHVFASGSSSGGGIGSGDPGASYIILNATASLLNERVLTAGTNISFVDGGPGGNLTINATGGSGDNAAQYLTLANTASLSAERLFSASIGLTPNDGGANNTYSLRVDDNIIDTTASMIVIAAELDAINDELELLSGTISGSFGTPHAEYLTLAASSQLSSERVFTNGTGLNAVDGGANSTYTLSINNNVVATVSGTRFTGPVSASAGLSGSLQQVAPNLSYLVAGSNVTITSQSNGQVIIASTGGSSSSASPTSEFWATPTSPHASDFEGTETSPPSGWGFFRDVGGTWTSVSSAGAVDFESSPSSATFRASFNTKQSWLALQPSLDYGHLFFARRIIVAPTVGRYHARMLLSVGHIATGTFDIGIHVTPDNTTVPAGFSNGNWINCGWVGSGASLTCARTSVWNGAAETLSIFTGNVDPAHMGNSELVLFINSGTPNNSTSHRTYVRSAGACRQIAQFAHATFTGAYWIGWRVFTTNSSTSNMPFAPIYCLDYFREVDSFTSFIP